MFYPKVGFSSVWVIPSCESLYHPILCSNLLFLMCRSPSPYEALCLGVPFINPIVKVRLTLLLLCDVERVTVRPLAVGP
jgi:hypothetical protein